MKTSAHQRRIIRQQSSARHQSGAALIFSMAILLVLTILGMSAMRTTALEQIMAGNTQEMTRAFQAADSGLSKAIDSIDTRARTSVSADPSTFAAATYTFGNASAAAAVPALLQIGKGSRGAAATDEGFCFAYHGQSVTGTSQTAASTVLNHGMRSGAPGDPSRDTPCS